MSELRNSRGFTLVEAMVSMALGSILMLAVLSTYIYLGRNLTKVSNLQILEAKSRIALGLLNRDFQRANAVTSPTDTSVTLTVPPSNYTITYNYDSVNKELTRTSNVPLDAFSNATLLNGDCTSLTFNYYSTTGVTALSSTALVPLSVKRISVTFILQRGANASGTLAQLQTSSARTLMRNKALPSGS